MHFQCPYANIYDSLVPRISTIHIIIFKANINHVILLYYPSGFEKTDLIWSQIFHQYSRK